MNFDSFDPYPDLKEAVEDCYEAQDDQTAWIVRNHPGVQADQVAIEMLYHLVLRLLWMGERDFADNAIVRRDDERRARMRALAKEVDQHGIEGSRRMLRARNRALAWGALPGVLADDISTMLEFRLEAVEAETRLTRLHNEAAAAAARLEDRMGEDVVLFVYGAAQTYDRAKRRSAPQPTSS